MVVVTGRRGRCGVLNITVTTVIAGQVKQKRTNVVGWVCLVEREGKKVIRIRFEIVEGRKSGYPLPYKERNPL